MNLPPPAECERRSQICDRLASLWDDARVSAAFCGPGCSCGAGMLFAIEPQAIEADVLAYLAARFPAETAPSIARLLDDRDLPAPRAGPPFGAWLRALASAPLTAVEFDALAGSLLPTLESLSDSGGSGPRSRFVCA